MWGEKRNNFIDIFDSFRFFFLTQQSTATLQKYCYNNIRIDRLVNHEWNTTAEERFECNPNTSALWKFWAEVVVVFVMDINRSFSNAQLTGLCRAKSGIKKLDLFLFFFFECLYNNRCQYWDMLKTFFAALVLSHRHPRLSGQPANISICKLQFYVTNLEWKFQFRYLFVSKWDKNSQI